MTEAQIAMDWQLVINVVALIVPLAGSVVAWFVNIMWAAQQRTAQELHALEASLPLTYAKREDLRNAVGDLKATQRDDMREIRDALARIFDKLDDKLDKDARRCT